MRHAPVLIALVALIALLILPVACKGSDGASRAVVVFVSHDRVFSEPILDAFQQQSGITVKAVYDTEATKTTGLVTRLMSRADRPEADVFWNNEVGQTLLLQRAGLLERYVPMAAEDIPKAFLDMEGHWSGYAVRARVILVNTALVPAGEEPRTIDALTQPEWKGKVAIARPLFGTTKTHMAALFATLGPAKARAWFERLLKNDAKVVEGNAVARNLVAEGQIAVCLTDTDDANGAFIKGAPVKMIYPDQGPGELGTLLIPNSVCLIKGGPNPQEARELIEYLISKEVEARLAKGKAAQMPVRKDVPPHSPRFDLSQVKGMEVTPAQIADQMPAVQTYLEKRLRK